MPRTASPKTKRHQRYLDLVIAQHKGEHAVDEADIYRDRGDLVSRALQAYELRHGIKLETGRLYFHPAGLNVCCYPDAIEAGLIGITVHVRRNLETYRDAIDRGVDHDMERHAHAMMACTGMRYWIHLNYLEDPQWKKRALTEHIVMRNKYSADNATEFLGHFLLKSRLEAPRESIPGGINVD